MHSDLVELGWTEEHWNRITSAMVEEAQKARVAAQMLPVVGPEDPSTIAVPEFKLAPKDNPLAPPKKRLSVDSSPTLFLTTIAVNLQLRSHEMADPSLKAALGMFRRAASYIARLEDCLVFQGRPKPSDADPQPFPKAIPEKIKDVAIVSNDTLAALPGLTDSYSSPRLAVGLAKNASGDDVINAIVAAIGKLDHEGHQAPYGAALSQDLFDAICRPNEGSLVLPRDRILPFLQGPLLRASAVPDNHGVVVSLSGNPLELVVGSDLSLRYLQTTVEPRYVFRMSERVALRIREADAICVLHPPQDAK